jgi:hypothetical protein
VANTLLNSKNQQRFAYLDRNFAQKAQGKWDLSLLAKSEPFPFRFVAMMLPDLS